MELLSPAGNREALGAAIACGADAVYLGYTAFGARSYAGNFDKDQLREALDFAHERGRKIYVTVNTLVKQSEIDDLADVLELLCTLGADAIIVQDAGVARIAQERFPELTLHASTQMTVNNAQGARLLHDMGFARVVPARECPLSELRKMADTGVEIEAFAHGALCVAVSGQCLFSSMIGGRSGNRGRCAQPCRLPYRLDDGTSGYLLSTKDLMLIDRIPEMRDAGVYSFKLEGRMKRPEYVGVITRAYREAIDAAEAHVPYRADEKTLYALRQIFNRGGFTEGYVMDKSNAALMSWERPNHWGIRMGKITAMRGPLAKVLLDEDLHDGDGLQVRGRNETEVTYSGNETRRGMEATVRIANGQARPGDAVYRLTDAMQMKEIREYVSKEHAQIPLEGELAAVPGKPAVLTLRDHDGHEVCVTGSQNVDAAQQRALDRESAMKQLGKTGGTPYVLTDLTVVGENAFMTAGMLNSLRRDALEAMRQERIRIVRRDVRPRKVDVTLPTGKPVLSVQGEDIGEAKALLESGADVFLWEPQRYNPKDMLAAMEGAPDMKVALVLPAVMRTDELEHVHDFVMAHADRFIAVVANNIGQFGMSWPVPVWGGQGLNIFNSESAKFYYALGAERLTASCELSAKELAEATAEGGDSEIEVYGRAMLMLLSHCPRRTRAGDGKQDAACDACAKNGGCPEVYTDRKGYRFPVRRLKMEHGCVVRLYNSVVTDMAKYARRLHESGCSLRLCFTDETPERRRELVASYRRILDIGEAAHTMENGATAGHFMRGVE